MLNPITNTAINPKDYTRYARQIIIKEINIQGQKRLKQSKILCIGAGGLNSPALLYLAACGIGVIGIVDNDNIEVSNLQRQIIFKSRHIGTAKVKAGFNVLKSLNPFINICIYEDYLTKKNVNKLILDYDIILDGSDNYESRYIISQYCYKLHKIHIYGAIEKFIGQISVFNYQNGPHYYSLYNNISNIKLQNCNEIGIINTLASIVGTLQATEAIKIILGIGCILSKKLLTCNILQTSFKKINIKPNKIKEKIIIQSYIKYSQTKTIMINQNIEEYQFIDVREPQEYKKIYIEKAINIPLTRLKHNNYLQKIKTTNKNKFIIYCNDESRSYVASKILHKYKIDHYILSGGIKGIRKERDSNPR